MNDHTRAADVGPEVDEPPEESELREVSDDVPVADAIEQHQAVVATDAEARDLPPDASEADALDQARPVDEDGEADYSR